MLSSRNNKKGSEKGRGTLSQGQSAAVATETIKAQAASTPQKRSYSTYETESKNTPVAKRQNAFSMLMNKPNKADSRATNVIEFENRVEFFQQTLDSDDYLMSQAEWIAVVKKTITDSVRMEDVHLQF